MGFVGSVRKLGGRIAKTGAAIGVASMAKHLTKRKGKSKSTGKHGKKTMRKRKGKRSRSHTQNMRIQETELEGISVHNDMIQTSLNMHLGRFKKIKSYGKFEYQLVTNYISEGLEGRQRVENLLQFCNLDQLMGYNQVGDSFTKLGTDLYTLNPFTKPTGSAVIGNAQYDNDAMYLDHIIGHFHFSNLQPVPAQMDLFFLTPNYDTDLDPRAAWDNLLNDQKMGQTVQTFRALATTAPPADGAAASSMVGQSPFQIKEWKKLYHAIGYKKILLQPGDQQIVKYKINYGHIIRRALIKQRNTMYLKGLTVIPMIICRGAIVEIKDTATTAMTYAETNIGMVLNAKYVLRNPPIDRFSNFRTSYQVVANDNPGAVHAAITSTDLREYVVNVADTLVSNKNN